jgi:hypothetical protein
MNRKYSRLESQIGNVMNLLSQQITSQASPAKGEATDEELFSLAQQGDRAAFDLYMERKAQKGARSEYESQARNATVNQQLNSLATRYPVFNDSTHPLTQTVQAAYQIMIRQGYPQGNVTLLDAMKTAIADRPDLVADIVGRTPEAARVSATRRAQAGQTGATTRDVPVGSGRTHQVTGDQARLAKAYGVKDPAKSIERFKQRRESGASQLGAVGSMLTDEEIS